MKKKLAFALLAIAVLVGGTLQAQTADLSSVSENVKILPAKEKGIIRVLYALESESPVTIKFLNRDGEIGSDEITRDLYEKGFLKWYDISHIESADFMVEISTENATVQYRIAQSKDRKTFEPILEKVTYKEVLTASKKSSRKN